MLHYLRVGSRITITQSHTHTMQDTHTHKAVTGRVEAKKVLSRRRQSEYRDFWLGNFCWPTRKREARKKRESGEEKKENQKREGGKLKLEGGKVTKWKWGEDFFFFFCFSLFKTTEICFGSTKMGIFYRKKEFHTGKKIWGNDFAPSEKYFSYTTGRGELFSHDKYAETQKSSLYLENKRWYFLFCPSSMVS